MDPAAPAPSMAAPPQKKAKTSADALGPTLRGTATGAVHGDALALDEGDVPAWAFSSLQELVKKCTSLL